ncbi:hypothetical protein Dimus_012295 [Dionaea muscipula]
MAAHQAAAAQGSLVGDDFFEQILSVPAYSTAADEGGGFVSVSSDHGVPMALGLGTSDGPGHHHHHHHHHGLNVAVGGVYRGMAGLPLPLPLGLNLDNSSPTTAFLKPEDGDACNNASSSSSSSRINEGDSMQHMANLFPAFAQMQPQSVGPPSLPIHQLHQHFQGQPAPAPAPAVSHPPGIRPRVRARRGQATDPHSIAERLRRERIAERMKALQELVPSCNKTDRAAMLDEIVDYVKFLRLQVKVLSMSRLGGADAVAQLVADVPSSSIEREGIGGGEVAWEKWSNDGTEQQVAKLLEEDVGAAMQLLQSKALCIMPISLASAIFHTQSPDATPLLLKPGSNNHPSMSST